MFFLYNAAVYFIVNKAFLKNFSPIAIVLSYIFLLERPLSQKIIHFGTSKIEMVGLIILFRTFFFKLDLDKYLCHYWHVFQVLPSNSYIEHTISLVQNIALSIPSLGLSPVLLWYMQTLCYIIFTKVWLGFVHTYSVQYG